MASAAGRRRSNHRETRTLIAAPLVSAQPDRGEQRRRHEVPRLGRVAPARHAERGRRHPGARHRHRPEAREQRRQPRDKHGAGEEVQGDRRRDQRQRPAFPRVQGVQVHGRAVEADAPGQHREHEGGADHLPAEEAPCAPLLLRRRRRHAVRFSHAAASLAQAERRRFAAGRSEGRSGRGGTCPVRRCTQTMPNRRSPMLGATLPWRWTRPALVGQGTRRCHMGSPSPELSALWLARAFNAQDVEAAAALYHARGVDRGGR